MFCDLHLARRLERTEASAGAAFVEARGGESTWTKIAGAYAMYDGVSSPLTQTFGLGLFEAANQQVLAQLEDFFHSRGAAVDHEVSPLAGVGLLQTLAERGYAPLEISNVLVLDLSAPRPQALPNPQLLVLTATTANAEQYSRAAAQGWSDMGEVAQAVAELAQIMFAARGYTGFLLQRNSQIIATGGLIVHNKVGLLAGASTVPAARGQGAQQALLAARLHHAAESGL